MLVVDNFASLVLRQTSYRGINHVCMMFSRDVLVDEKAQLTDVLICRETKKDRSDVA